MTEKILLWGEGGRQASAKWERENQSSGTSCKNGEDGSRCILCKNTIYSCNIAQKSLLDQFNSKLPSLGCTSDH